MFQRRDEYQLPLPGLIGVQRVDQRARRLVRRILIDGHAAVSGAAIPFAAMSAIDLMANNPHPQFLIGELAADTWITLNWLVLLGFNPGNFLQIRTRTRPHNNQS